MRIGGGMKQMEPVRPDLGHEKLKRVRQAPACGAELLSWHGGTMQLARCEVDLGAAVASSCEADGGKRIWAPGRLARWCVLLTGAGRCVRCSGAVACVQSRGSGRLYKDPKIWESLEKVSILIRARNSRQRKCTINNDAFILAPLPGRVRGKDRRKQLEAAEMEPDREVRGGACGWSVSSRGMRPDHAGAVGKQIGWCAGSLAHTEAAVHNNGRTRCAGDRVCEATTHLMWIGGGMKQMEPVRSDLGHEKLRRVRQAPACGAELLSWHGGTTQLALCEADSGAAVASSCEADGGKRIWAPGRLA
ncbi:hypothetical protein Taro_049288 [Colocasia esculenta]|uniref:Uncharacterized protein n=1 Tax=Colocasia esculenta TaxID=4460 RepID=A0A843XAN5_COLES|nr:hypothetical protein [Colocasia esculenta]